MHGKGRNYGVQKIKEGVDVVLESASILITDRASQQLHRLILGTIIIRVVITCFETRAKFGKASLLSLWMCLQISFLLIYQGVCLMD